MKFSVIIPAYNAEKYLYDCIESLDKQSFKDFEIIIVDDGSTDNTLMLSKEIEKKFENMCFVIVHQENKGQIAARLNGVNNSKGEYCMFVDSDDKLRNDALDIVNNAIKDYNADIIIYNGVRFGNWGETQFWDHYYDYCTYIVNDKYELFKKIALTSNRFNNIWNKAFKSDVIKKAVKLEGVDFIRSEEDFLMQLPWYDTANSAVYIPENIYYYRLNDNGVSTIKFDPYKFKSALKIFEITNSYLSKWKICDCDIIIRDRFIQRTIASLKQLYYCKTTLDITAKKMILDEIKNNDIFRKEYPSFSGNTSSLVGRFCLWLLYHGFVGITLFIIEHDPKLHGRNEYTSTFGSKK